MRANRLGICEVRELVALAVSLRRDLEAYGCARTLGISEVAEFVTVAENLRRVLKE